MHLGDIAISNFWSVTELSGFIRPCRTVARGVGWDQELSETSSVEKQGSVWAEIEQLKQILSRNEQLKQEPVVILVDLSKSIGWIYVKP